MDQQTTPNPDVKKKSRSQYLSIDQFLERSHTALTNARTPDVAPLLELRGYIPVRVADQLIELDRLRSLHQEQKKEYGEQYEATEAYEHARDAAHDSYMDHLKLARIAFKSDIAAQMALGLQGARARSQSGYISQGLQFYSALLGNVGYQTTLSQKGVTHDEVIYGQQAFTGLLRLTAAQQKETAEAQAATSKRDAAYDAASEWMSDFYETAKVALRKHPQMLERLGVREE